MNDRIKELLEQNLTLYSMLYETLEKQGCDNVASTIDQMTGQHLEEQANWYKGNKTSEELNTRLVEEMELSAERRQIIEDLTLENRVLADELKKKDELLAEKERQYEVLSKLFSEQHEIIDQMELECFEEVNRLLKEQKDFFIVEKSEWEKVKQGGKDILVEKMQNELAKKNEQLERYKTWYIELAEDSKNKYNEMYEFCIEQLNQVKDDILDYTNVYWRTFSKTQDNYMLYDDLEDCLKEFIGKRIEKLREAIQK